MRLFLLLLLTSLTLSACGQKGPLYHAPEMTNNQDKKQESKVENTKTAKELEQQ